MAFIQAFTVNLIFKRDYQLKSQIRISQDILQKKSLEILSGEPNGISHKICRFLIPWKIC